jgi:hypothetical protein
MVQMGLRCEYIMRAILALSALHLASQRSDRRAFYTSQGLKHHQIASKLAIDLMAEVSAEGAKEQLVFSILTIYFGMFPSNHSESKKSSNISTKGLPVLENWMVVSLSNEARYPIGSI